MAAVELLYVGSMKEDAFLIVIPLAPRCAFVYFGNHRTWENLQKQSDAAFAKRVNFETVSTSARYVFAADDRQAEFVAKHLGSAFSGD
ncbi:hypothetical protein GCM10023165_10380 [Variovorax defluvii]|uniref:Uncharacterized protein n=1 Tax=Variovorax defluvii TaxID=913761 RepID=A0ABP8H532_9BURK